MVRLLWIRVRRGGDCQQALYEQLSAFIPLIRKDKSRKWRYFPRVYLKTPNVTGSEKFLR
jgi:hypothetical protein